MTRFICFPDSRCSCSFSDFAGFFFLGVSFLVCWSFCLLAFLSLLVSTVFSFLIFQFIVFHLLFSSILSNFSSFIFLCTVIIFFLLSFGLSVFIHKVPSGVILKLPYCFNDRWGEKKSMKKTFSKRG